MQYVSMDIETTGLNAQRHQMIEFCAIGYRDCDKGEAVENLPRFHCYLKWDEVLGQPKALSMNQRILKHIADTPISTEFNTTDVLLPNMFDGELKKWLINLGFDQPIIPAGKNFSGFDRWFIQTISSVKFMHRTLDPMMLYTEPSDIDPPDLKDCLIRAGLSTDNIHDCITDCMNVVRLLQYKGF